jgi:hypothetical protein
MEKGFSSRQKKKRQEMLRNKLGLMELLHVEWLI